MKTLIVVFLLMMSVGASISSAQTIKKNPSAVEFLCPDHALDNQHEVDIVRVSDGVVVQTILGGDPALNAANEVVIPVNVQPVSFGLYRFVVRAVAGTVESDNSDPSANWERAPGKPTTVEAR